MIFLCITGMLVIIVRSEEISMEFPEGFKFGVATSSYQIEGAWNISDKGVNVWDHFTHDSSHILDGSNGDVACDSYHRYKEDIAILKDLGVDFYRLSLSWARILPTGFADKVSQDGIQYYKNLLDDLHAVGIEPFVTISHWDHPLVLEEMGGWTNELMATWFADYATVVFRELGGRIKLYATLNEPVMNCRKGYGDGTYAPGKKLPNIGPYLCVHNMLKAHAKVYNIYNTEFRKVHGGQIGIVMECDYYYPKYVNDTETSDIEFAFECGWIANPILSEKGDYPDVMKQRIDENSKLEGFPRSRLPKFTQKEIDYIKGTFDYVGLNHYTSLLTEPAPKSNNTVWYNDKGTITSLNLSWPETGIPGLRVMSQGFGDTLRKIKNLYKNPPVYVMENGMPDRNSIHNDYQRIEYLHDYLKELLIAVNRDGCNVKSYAVWSLIDNFEWNRGYTAHFGLVSVDFDNPSKPRIPKLSCSWFHKLLRTRKLPSTILPNEMYEY